MKFRKYCVVLGIIFLGTLFPHTYKNPNWESNMFQQKKSLLLGCTVNINVATLDELIELPSIGPSKANKIQKQRPYSKPEDIMKVKGIGLKTYQKLQPYIRTNDEPCNFTF